jgi:hypothetical protein
MRLIKNDIASAPVQYTRLISFTPPANKPAELHREGYWDLCESFAKGVMTKFYN